MSLRYNIKNDRNIKTHIFFKPTETNNLQDIKAILEADNDFNIYPNDEQEPNSYNTYKNATDYIYRIVSKSEFLCKGLNPSYVLNAFDNVDAVIIIGSSMDILPNGNIYGFALINFDEEMNAIYVDVICSHIGIKGAGDVLINKIEYLTRKLFMTNIYLTSVDSAISFYERYGFIKLNKSCVDMCSMIKYINRMNKKRGGKRRTNKRRHSMKKTRKSRR